MEYVNGIRQTSWTMSVEILVRNSSDNILQVHRVRVREGTMYAYDKIKQEAQGP